jgi:ribA/ribD-fused uncharacterized protein
MNGKNMQNELLNDIHGHFYNDKYVFFWGGRFSNWAPAKIVWVDDVWGEQQFNCSEQMYMFFKAKTFKDEVSSGKILMETDPEFQKQLGREVKGFNQNVWDQYKEQMMFIACFEKFNQNDNYKKILLETGDKIIVEASPFDKIWGIGLGIGNPDILDESKWNGQNLLGKVLMDVRTKLKETNDIIF